MSNKNPYTWTGFSLMITGALLTPTAHFVFHITWLAALGVGMLIMSFILVALGKSIPNISPEVSSLLLETGVNNIATVIEELGIKSRAIYLPSSLARDCPRAFIPLHPNGASAVPTRALPQRFIARYGSAPDDIGLLVTTIGSAACGMLDIKPGPTATELETALTNLFAGRLGVADGARVISRDDTIRVEIIRSRLHDDDTWSHQCLGGPLASLVASVAAEAWDRPVRIRQESRQKDNYLVELEVA